MDQSYHMIKLCLIGAFASFASMCAICFILRPELLFDHPHWGISYYATLPPTIAPYTLGFVCGVACLAAIAHRLRVYGSQMRTIRIFFTVIANSLLGILLTPMAVHSALWWAHMVVGVIMLLTQLTLTVWALRQANITIVERVLAFVSFAAAALLILSNDATALLGLYTLGQILALGACLALLGRITLRRIHYAAKAPLI